MIDRAKTTCNCGTCFYLRTDRILQLHTEAVTQRCSVKKIFLKFLNTCARVSFLIELQARPATLLKKRLWRRYFPVNFEKFLSIPFFIEHLRWLLLYINCTWFDLIFGGNCILKIKKQKYLNISAVEKRFIFYTFLI